MGKRTPLRIFVTSVSASTSNRQSWPQRLHRIPTCVAPSWGVVAVGIAETALHAGHAIGNRTERVTGPR
jgi:hypothetical protein